MGVPATQTMGMIADQLRANLRQVAISDAKALRATQELLSEVHALAAGQTEQPLLAADRTAELEAAAELLRSAGWTVTPPAA